MGGAANGTVFVSYARADADDVAALVRRLEAFGHGCFYDQEMLGGDRWWHSILDEIAARPILLFVVSPDSVRSRACRTELHYAAELGKAVVPIMIRATKIEDVPDDLQPINVQTFINPIDEDWARLDATLDRGEEEPWTPLPDPMPEAPPPPMADLSWARSTIVKPDLSPDEQRELLSKLAMQVQNGDDRPAVVAVLEQLLTHHNVVQTVATETAHLLARYREPPRDQRSMNLLRTVVRSVERGRCIPILGSGMTDWLVGTRKDLARSWAREYHYPLHLGYHDDLPQVAQYLSVTATTDQVREDLGAFYRNRLKAGFPHVVRGAVDGVGRARLDEILVDVWRSESTNVPGEPHRVLARLPCRIFVNAQPTSLLRVALEAEGKRPREHFCAWNRRAIDEWPVSPFAADRSYVPSVDEPLVYHVFGTLEHPESIVISEDDYFEFLTVTAEQPDLMPIQVTEAIAESSLLFLGFGLQDWDVRVLLRTLINREVAEALGQRFKHVAAEIDDHEGARSQEDAREYLRQYFGRFRQPPIDIFWASVESFCEALELAWQDPDSRAVA